MQLAQSSDFTIICTGGILTKDEYTFVSDFATMILDKVNIDIHVFNCLRNHEERTYRPKNFRD